MRKTYCEARMKFVDVNASGDATTTSSTKMSYSNLNLLNSDNLQTVNYSWLEKNSFILDGTKTILPDNPTNVPFVSSAMSNAECVFNANPKITITFDDVHSSAGITLTFIEDYPTKAKIEWFYDSTKICGKDYDIDSLEFVINEPAQNYNKIVIEFKETRLPLQYIKLQGIKYGIVLSWKSSDITSASVVEEIDLTSSTLSINTASVSILDRENLFNPSNNDGLWKYVQKNQEVNLTEYIDNVPTSAGTFFIDKMESASNSATFSMIDLVGLLDNYTFYDGDVYSDELASNIIDSILDEAGIANYTISEDVANTRLSGRLGIMTCREALQMVCFACGAVADDSRSNSITISKPDRYISRYIGTARKFDGNTKVSLSDYISGVNIEYQSYSVDASASEVFKGNLPKGQSRVEFTDSVSKSTISVSGGSLIKAMPNYCIVNMANAGACTISAKKYTETKYNCSVNVDVIDAGETPKVKSFSGCTLYSRNSINDVAQYLLDYYSLRKNVEMKYILENEKSGNWVNITSKDGTVNTTLISSQTINLSGGFIATSKCVGYSISLTDFDYTGELYTGTGGVL